MTRRTLFGLLAAAAVVPPDTRPVQGPRPLRWGSAGWSEAMELWPSDTFTIEGVYVVGPSGTPTEFRQRFVVTEHSISTNPVPMWPHPMVSGRYKNVSALPAEGALIKLGWG